MSEDDTIIILLFSGHDSSSRQSVLKPFIQVRKNQTITEVLDKGGTGSNDRSPNIRISQFINLHVFAFNSVRGHYVQSRFVGSDARDLASSKEAWKQPIRRSSQG